MKPPKLTNKKAKIKNSRAKANAKTSLKEKKQKRPKKPKVTRYNRPNGKVYFNELTPEEREFISLTYLDENLKYNEKVERITKRFGIVDRTVRNWWVQLNIIQPISKLPKQLQKAQSRNIDSDTDILLVTSVQNTTSILHNLLSGMQEYVKIIKKKYNLKAQIVVVPLRYRNPTSPTEDVSEKNTSSQWWVTEVEDYLFYNKIQFGDVLVSSDRHIKPTRKQPLMGLTTSGDYSIIVGSPRIHFHPLPRFRGDNLRVACTTGSLSVKNYSRSGAGDDGFEHHSYGFVVVEKKKDGTCHMPRNVYADSSGKFIDLVHEYDGSKIKNNNKAGVIVWGDIHRELMDEKVYNKTVEICKKIQPNEHICHDVLDGYRFNPHERKDYFIQRQKILEGKYHIKEEVEQAVNFPEQLLRDCKGESVKVIESNHDIFLDRHINDIDWKKDLHNSSTYLEYAHIQQTVNLKEHGSIYGYLIYKKYNNHRVNYIPYGTIYKYKGILLSAHGDFGTNGSRGSIKQFKSANTKIIHGHNHTPILMDGASSVGLTAILSQHYTRKGMSTHANAHMFVYTNGKRQMLCFGDDFEVSYFL